MPKKLEEALRKRGAEMGLKGERLDAFVYETMRKRGWKPAKEKK